MKKTGTAHNELGMLPRLSVFQCCEQNPVDKEHVIKLHVLPETALKTAEASFEISCQSPN